MLIDTHSHINFKAYKNDADKVIQRAFDNDIWQVVVGSELKTSQRAIEYAEKYDKGVYAAVGLHPFHVWEHEVETDEYSMKAKGQLFDIDDYNKLLESKKVVAVGEIGLDYFHLQDDKDKDDIIMTQKHEFQKQLRYAYDKNLPCIVHCRAAHDDVLEFFNELSSKNKLPKVVMHCYSGDLEQAKKYLDLGCLISFTGLITFSHDWDEVIKWLPLEKMMVETDCPYMTPEPFRGKRNEPLYVKYVAEKIAELKGVGFEEVAEVTTRNAKEFFGITDPNVPN